MKSIGGDSGGNLPLLGLIMAGALAVLWNLCHNGIGTVLDQGRIQSPVGSCAYQIFIDGSCRGTVFCDGPPSLVEHLRTAGLLTDSGTASSLMDIPCNSAVRLDSDLGLVGSGKMRGGFLLCAGKPVNLNVADERDLAAINGIGERLAHRIVQYRSRHGSFSHVEELLLIPGIGDKKLARVKPYLTIPSITEARGTALRPRVRESAAPGTIKTGQPDSL
ncbi:ComEA family DNA-binding protein [Thermodesulfobacteriota bacterium]